MPGIAGMVSPLERDALPAILDRMLNSMHRSPKYDSRVWVEHETGLVVTGPRSGDMLVSREHYTLALVGRIVPDTLLSDRLRMAPGPPLDKRLPDCLLELYQRLGPQALEGLNGSYVIVVWDDPRARLTIISDRYGIQPFYYWKQGRRLVFASRLAAIAAHPVFSRQVNPVAVFDLLATGQMLDERTLFTDAQALPPAARLTFERGKFELVSYWQPACYTAESPDISEQEALEEMAGRVVTAVSRQVDSIASNCAWFTRQQEDELSTSFDGVLPTRASERIFFEEPAARPSISLLLTGGLDSRLLAGALIEVAAPGAVSAVTIGHESARDVVFGSQIAAAAGMAHTILPAVPSYLSDYAPECVRRSEGGMSVFASWILAASAHLASTPAVMTGVGAEVLSGRHWLAKQHNGTRQETLDRLCQVRWAFGPADSLMHVKLRAGVLSASRDSLQRTLMDSPADHLIGWTDSIAYRQDRRHPTGNILSEDAIVLEPFFDNDLADFAYRLPPDFRAQGRLYKQMILQRFPEISVIGYTGSGALLSEETFAPDIHVRAREWWQNVHRRIMRRLASSAPFLGLPVTGDNPTHVVHYNSWLRTASRAFVQNLLSHSELYDDFMDANRVRAMVEDHMSGRINAYRQISAVVTFALWRQMAT